MRRSQAIRFILAEHEIEHYFRDAWAIGAELGTEEEHKDEIAQRVLGAR